MLEVTGLDSQLKILKLVMENAKKVFIVMLKEELGLKQMIFHLLLNN